VGEYGVKFSLSRLEHKLRAMAIPEVRVLYNEISFMVHISWCVVRDYLNLTTSKDSAWWTFKNMIQSDMQLNLEQMKWKGNI
jgi:hypothetical protein